MIYLSEPPTRPLAPQLSPQLLNNATDLVFMEVAGRELVERRKKYKIPATGLVRIMPYNCLFPKFIKGLIWDISQFKFRSDDILIIGYPRSGASWVQEIVWQMVFNKGGATNNLTEPIHLRTPLLESDGILGPDEYKETYVQMQFSEQEPPSCGAYLDYIGKLQGRRIMKTRLYNGMLPPVAKGMKRIYVMRHIPDVICSYYRWHIRYLPMEASITILNFEKDLLNGNVIYGNVVTHMEDWIIHDGGLREDILIVPYLYLKEFPLISIKRIAKYLNIRLSERELSLIEERTKFEVMRDQIHDSMGPATIRSLFRKNNIPDKSTAFHSGEINIMKSLATKESHDRLENEYAEFEGLIYATVKAEFEELSEEGIEPENPDGHDNEAFFQQSLVETVVRQKLNLSVEESELLAGVRLCVAYIDSTDAGFVQREDEVTHKPVCKHPKCLPHKCISRKLRRRPPPLPQEQHPPLSQESASPHQGVANAQAHSQPEEVTVPAAEDSLMQGVGQPEDSQMQGVRQPKDSQGVGQPEDSQMHGVRQSKDSQGVGQPEDSHMQGVGQPEDSRMQGVGQPKDSPMQGVGQPEDSPMQGVGQPEDSYMQGVGQPEDSPMERYRQLEDLHMQIVRHPEDSNMHEVSRPENSNVEEMQPSNSRIEEDANLDDEDMDIT